MIKINKGIMTNFWLNDINVLIRMFKDMPTKFNFIDKLNLIFLLSFIISIILILLNKFELSYILISIIIGFLTIIIYNQYIENIKETYKNKCLNTSINNPFMNPNILYPSSIPPCIIDNDIINEMFLKNTFRDFDDIYNKKSYIRQFYTVPSKTIPNDRETLIQWLYNSNNNKKSCKEGNMYRCIKNINLDRHFRN